MIFDPDFFCTCLQTAELDGSAPARLGGSGLWVGVLSRGECVLEGCPRPGQSGDLLLGAAPLDLTPQSDCHLVAVRLGGSCADAYLLRLGAARWADGASCPLPPLVAQAVSAIRQNYMALYGVEELSEQLGVTKSHLVRAFKQALGVPPGHYLTSVRIEAVKNLLLADTYNLETIAGLTGYSSANYLCRVFKREVGVSPAAWRAGAAPLPTVPKLPPRGQEMFV